MIAVWNACLWIVDNKNRRDVIANKYRFEATYAARNSNKSLDR